MTKNGQPTPSVRSNTNFYIAAIRAMNVSLSCTRFLLLNLKAKALDSARS